MNAPAATQAPSTPPCTCEPRRAPSRPRERWVFEHRTTAFGHVYLVWRLEGTKRRWVVMVG